MGREARGNMQSATCDLMLTQNIVLQVVVFQESHVPVTLPTVVSHKAPAGRPTSNSQAALIRHDRTLWERSFSDPHKYKNKSEELTSKHPCFHSNVHCGCQHSVWWLPPLFLPCTPYRGYPESQEDTPSRRP